jgi:pimeloyl-ACP methyl ester carboxylesterase
MKHTLRFSILFTLMMLGMGFLGMGQRTLPYPIILVHGLGGDYTSWNEFASYLNNNVGLNVPTNSFANSLDFNLNCDGNDATSWYITDYCDVTNTSLLRNCDAYIVDFDHGTKSNQAAIFKQGLAIRDAIRHVRDVTGADKVILMGHSMGGLAARDYLQNQNKWQSDGQHHVAKLVTIGTPHGGSNGSSANGSLLFGSHINELSEAVRDLRYSYSTTGYNGAYLLGGYEYASRIRGRVSDFDNIDVNCNGLPGDYITGINQSPSTIPTNLSYSCVRGRGKVTYTGLYGLSSIEDGDQIVESVRANLNNYFSVGASVFDIYTGTPYTILGSFHTHLQKDFPTENLWALDEPSNDSHAYELIPNRPSSYTGLFTKQSSGSLFDIDSYKSNLSKGITKITVNSVVGASPSILFADPYGSTVAMVYGTATTTSQTVVRANNYSGTYKVALSGYAPTGLSRYTYDVYNIASPSLYANATSTCNQNTSLVASESGYDSYDWYRNGQYFATSSTHYINASTTASGATLFTVRVSKWGVTIDGLNSSQVTNYTPLSTASLTASANGELSATVLNVCSGTPVLLSATCATNTYPVWWNGLYSNATSTSASIYANATTTASYTARCSNYFCISANSPPVRIVKEPSIQSVKTGDWQDATTWSCNCIPINCQDVSIEQGHTVNVPINDAKAKNITVKGILNFQNNAPPGNSRVSIGGI